MSDDPTTAKRIASELIYEIASEWSVVSTSRCIQEGDQFIFQFVLGRPLYTSLDEPEQRSSDSLVRFNPLSQATQIVLAFIEKLNGMTEMDAR